MPKIVTLRAGKRFGKWTLVSPAPMRVAKSGRTEKQWHVRCDCGTEKSLPQAKLRSGETVSCGCSRQDENERTAADLIGRRFARLTVVAEADRWINPKTGKPRRQWLCKCDCGNQMVAMLRRLETGHTRSCGCLQADTRRKHGHNTGAKTSTYMAWDAMIQRCLNPKSTKFSDYGGRGITVCERWRKFGGFLDDMGECPAGKTIDRIDNSRGYEPENCRWATRKEQQRNRRCTHYVEYLGRRMSVAEAAEIAGVVGNRLYPLLNHKGMSIERAIEHVRGQR